MYENEFLEEKSTPPDGREKKIQVFLDNKKTSMGI